jgi:hypothetical protein
MDKVQNTILVDGVERPAQNSKGQPIHATEEGTYLFWRKFGETKVTDEEGRPLIVYHATTQDFDEFKPGGFNAKLSGRAMWFTPDAECQPAAHNIGMNLNKPNEGTRVIPAYLDVKRPMVIDADTKAWARALYGNNFPQFIPDHAIDEIKRDYDGILYFDRDNKLAEVIVFDSTQIKSAIGNRGDFNQGNPNILCSLADVEPTEESLPDVVKSGSFAGRILDVLGGIVFQNKGGRGGEVRHDASKLLEVPGKDALVKIEYREDGMGMVTDLAKNRVGGVGR